MYLGKNLIKHEVGEGSLDGKQLNNIMLRHGKQVFPPLLPIAIVRGVAIGCIQMCMNIQDSGRPRPPGTAYD